MNIKHSFLPSDNTTGVGKILLSLGQIFIFKHFLTTPLWWIALLIAFSDYIIFCAVVYEVCKLGTHSPQNSGGQMELSPGKYLPSGLVLVECPDQVKKVGSGHLSPISSINDCLQVFSKHWSVKSFVTSVSRILRDIKLTSSISTNQKESSSGPCTVRPFSFLFSFPSTLFMYVFFLFHLYWLFYVL